MKVLHTSDWHLGHTLHGLERSFEHAQFLAWLLEQIAAEQVDALLITGDVFDSACPPLSAERAFYEFLAAARARRPGLVTLVIGGNHDSPQRLEATSALLRALDLHVLGRLPRIRPAGAASPQGELDLERILIPLAELDARGRPGPVAAWVAAVPFLRPADLPRGDGSAIAKAQDVYAQVLLAARGRRQAGQALLVTAHCSLSSAEAAGVSERVIHGGDALPAATFPSADVQYVAAGHIHRAQSVERESIRYAGSPLPLSFAEVDYLHEVRLLEFAGGALVAQRGLIVPRAVELLRVPAGGPAPLEEVLERLRELEPLRATPGPDLPAALASHSGMAAGGPECDPSAPPRATSEAESTRPYLEVRVACAGPAPGLRRQIEEALSDKRARLVKLEVQRETLPGESLADRSRGTHLRELEPEDVFRRCFAKAHPESEAPPPALEAAFASLLAELQAPPRAETDLELAREPQPRAESREQAPASTEPSEGEEPLQPEQEPAARRPRETASGGAERSTSS